MTPSFEFCARAIDPESYIVLCCSACYGRYDFFELPLTTSAQAAVSILGAVGAIAGLPSNVLGGLLADCMNKRVLLTAVRRDTLLKFWL
eukprot:SAG31_NODE_1442_length_8325_cov_5.564916_3_plen_89_part_00